MPRGSEHTLTGLVIADSLGLALEVDNGGRWQLDLRDDRKAHELINRRVTITGRRGGFDLLEVDTITLL